MRFFRVRFFPVRFFPVRFFPRTGYRRAMVAVLVYSIVLGVTGEGIRTGIFIFIYP